MSKIAVYYVGKNNDEQKTKRDLKVIDEWCRRNGYDYKLYIDNVEHRKDIHNRKSLDKLKEKISEGIYDTIALMNLSNISRDIFFNARFIKYAYDNKCKVRCLDGTNPYVLVNFYIRLTNKIDEVNKKEEGKIYE